MKRLISLLVLSLVLFGYGYIDLGNQELAKANGASEKFYMPNSLDNTISFTGGEIDGLGQVSGKLVSENEYPSVCDNRVIYLSFKVSEDGKQVIITNKKRSNGFTIRTLSGWRVQLIHENGTSWTSPLNTLKKDYNHILVWQHKTNDSWVYLDGEKYDVQHNDCVNLPSKYYINSDENNAYPFNGGIYMFAELSPQNFERSFELSQIVQQKQKEINDKDFRITFPQTKSTFQTQDNGLGKIRIKGFAEENVRSVDITIGNNTQFCNTPNGEINCLIEKEPGIYNIVISANGHSKTIEDVRVGDVYFVIGQSNAWRSSPAPNQSGIVESAMYSNLFPFAGKGWHEAYERSWHPNFMNKIHCSDPVAVVRHAVGSTSIDQWMNPSRENFIEDALNELSKSQGVDCLDCQKLAVATLWQHGETDAKNRTALSSYETSLNLLADRIDESIGTSLYISILQDIYSKGYTTEQAVLDIRQAQTNLINNNSNVFIGADLSDVIFSSSNAVHPRTTAEMELIADRWFVSLNHSCQ